MGIRHRSRDPPAAAYVFGLSLITEALALLSFGLVRGWGEVAPAWLPFIGGKRLAPIAVITTASLGGLGATAFWAPAAGLVRCG